jgi:hypothetical protein
MGKPEGKNMAVFWAVAPCSLTKKTANFVLTAERTSNPTEEEKQLGRFKRKLKDNTKIISNKYGGTEWTISI